MGTHQPSRTGPRQHRGRSRRTVAVALGALAAVGLATVLPAAADGRLGLGSWWRSDGTAVAVAPAAPVDAAPALP
ncbi:MAG: hypothetical protein HY830_24270, partial [Actinobacteria bacterium]|nr:hypothetical protein [Actinomycetota bacterium]